MTAIILADSPYPFHMPQWLVFGLLLLAIRSANWFWKEFSKNKPSSRMKPPVEIPVTSIPLSQASVSGVVIASFICAAIGMFYGAINAG